MSNLPEHIRRKIWERDRYRCQECGIKVGRDKGLRPQTHHITPRSSGGDDEEENLTTLCHVCHATKRSHTFMLDKTQVKDFPQYIKWCLWDISLNSLACAYKLDPQNFPSPQQVIEYIKKIQDGLEGLIPLIVDCEQEGIGKGDLIFEEDPTKEAQQYEDIIKGLRIGWMSHYHQRALDQIISESRERRQGHRCKQN